MPTSVLSYEGSSYLRQRLMLSTLTGKSVRITNIRGQHFEPGLTEYEMCFIKLLNEVTNGTVIDINQTGTELFFKPGVLHGGEIKWSCDAARSISYYLEGLIYLAPFCKYPMRATLQGITNDSQDISVDGLKHAWLPVLKRFLPDDEELEIKVNKRGYLPHGGGEVLFTCPICKTVKPVKVLKQGTIKKIRGLAFASKVSPLMGNRMIDAVKKYFAPVLSDVYIFTDHRKGISGGNSPGFGISLTAETADGVVFVGEDMSRPVGSGEPAVPEDVGQRAAMRLMDEIYRGGCCDSSAQTLAILCMALGQQDVSQFVTGPLSEFSITFLGHIKDFFNVRFKLHSHSMPLEEKPKEKSADDDELEECEADEKEEDFGMGSEKIKNKFQDLVRLRSPTVLIIGLDRF